MIKCKYTLTIEAGKHFFRLRSLKARGKYDEKVVKGSGYEYVDFYMCVCGP